MAFTNSPVNSTYETKRISAVQDLTIFPYDSAGGGTNRTHSGMINLVPRKIKEEGDELIVAETRSPILGATVGTATDVTGGQKIYVRGVYVWEKSSSNTYYFVVQDNKVYTSTTGLVSSWTAVTTLTNGGITPVGFTEFIDSTNVKKLVLVDGIEGYVFTTNGAGTKITDVDFPTPHVPYPVFIDGYLFLAKTDTGDIYNSDLNDPAVWTAGSFISSELYPDDVKALVKVNNYLLAIGVKGCEYFYDAGNATGTPLARDQGASLPFGTIAPFTIASNEDTIIMLANTNDGSASLKIIQGNKYKDITPSWLADYISITANGISIIKQIRSFFINTGSDLLYCMKVVTSLVVTEQAVNDCFVYSTNTGLWTEFYSQSTTTSTVGFSYFAVDCTTSAISSSLNSYLAGIIPGTLTIHFGSYGTNPVTFSSSTGNGGLDCYNTSTTTNINIELRTNKLNFGTLNRKFLNRFGIIVERSTLFTVHTVVSTAANLTLSMEDVDQYPYNSLSNPRAFQTDNFEDYPCITQLGSFRQRKFRLRSSGINSAMRIKYLEFDINKGQQ